MKHGDKSQFNRFIIKKNALLAGKLRRLSDSIDVISTQFRQRNLNERNENGNQSSFTHNGKFSTRLKSMSPTNVLCLKPAHATFDQHSRSMKCRPGASNETAKRKKKFRTRAESFKGGICVNKFSCLRELPNNQTNSESCFRSQGLHASAESPSNAWNAAANAEPVSAPCHPPWHIVITA